MKANYKTYLASIMALFFSTAVLADQGVCDGEGTVHVNKMGIVNEKILQESIDRLEKRMKRAHNARHARIQHDHIIKEHLADMKDAMTKLHNLMLKGGCTEAAHGATMDVRMEVMEKRMDMMQRMMEQMVEHIAEQKE